MRSKAFLVLHQQLSKTGAYRVRLEQLALVRPKELLAPELRRVMGRISLHVALPDFGLSAQFSESFFAAYAMAR